MFRMTVPKNAVDYGPIERSSLRDAEEMLDVLITCFEVQVPEAEKEGALRFIAAFLQEERS